MKAHAVGQREAVIRDLMDERMVKAEPALDGSEIAELDEAAQRCSDLGHVSPDEERGFAHIEHLAGDRGTLEKVAVGDRQLVEAGADRGLDCNGNVVPIDRVGPRELDHEERITFRAERRALIGCAGAHRE